MTRWLVILDGKTNLDVLEPAGQLLQASGNQVAVVEAPTADALRAIPGVSSVTQGLPEEHIYASLDDGTRLFVEAWALQDDMEGKTRKGDGLDWDATGREAP